MNTRPKEPHLKNICMTRYSISMYMAYYKNPILFFFRKQKSCCRTLSCFSPHQKEQKKWTKKTKKKKKPISSPQVDMHRCNNPPPWLSFKIQPHPPADHRTIVPPSTLTVSLCVRWQRPPFGQGELYRLCFQR